MDNVLDVLEEYDAVTEGEKVTISRGILEGTTLPWYRNYGTSPRYLSYTHVLYGRNSKGEEQDVSPWALFFRTIMDRTIEKYNLAPRGYKVLRAALNEGLNYSDPHGDIHLDYPTNNYLLILYLTSSSGGTNVYNYTREDPIKADNGVLLNSDIERGVWDLPLKKHIKCEENKIGAFNGKYYHAACPRKVEERRTICVFAIEPL